MSRLVIDRRIGEAVVLQTPAGPITLTVIGVKRGLRVLLGVKATASVRVDREEVHEARKESAP